MVGFFIDFFLLIFINIVQTIKIKFMKKKFINPAKFYSMAVVVKGIAYVSGHLPTDEKGNVVDCDVDIQGRTKLQTRKCLENLKGTVEASGFEMKDVVKTTIYLDAENAEEMFPFVNQVYLEFFPDDKPARATVGVKIPKPGAIIEIDCIATKED